MLQVGKFSGKAGLLGSLLGTLTQGTSRGVGQPESLHISTLQAGKVSKGDSQHHRILLSAGGCAFPLRKRKPFPLGQTEPAHSTAGLNRKPRGQQTLRFTKLELERCYANDKTHCDFPDRSNTEGALGVGKTRGAAPPSLWGMKGPGAQPLPQMVPLPWPEGGEQEGQRWPDSQGQLVSAEWQLSVTWSGLLVLPAGPWDVLFSGGA